jgi:hypothetical protein
MGIRPWDFAKGGGGDVDAWGLSRVLRRTGRAQGASSGATISVLVVTLTRGGAAAALARSAAALPRAICCQAYSLKSRVMMDRGTKQSDFPPNRSFVERYWG